MTLVIFLAALIGGMLIGLPICFALLFSGVCMMLYPEKGKYKRRKSNAGVWTL